MVAKSCTTNRMVESWNLMKNGMFTTYQLVQDFATTGWAHQLRTADLRKAASFTRTPRVFFSIIYMGSTWIHNISNSLINHLVGYTRYTPTIPTINHKFGICCLRTKHCLARHGIPWCLKWSNFKLIFSKPCPFLAELPFPVVGRTKEIPLVCCNSSCQGHTQQ